MKALQVVFVLMAASAAQHVEAAGITASNDWLQYDDGTSHWLCWDGVYRGVWFNVEDFIPGMSYWSLGGVEIWFYHHVDYPWDTSDFLCEVWNGDATGPVVFLGQTQATAVHNAPVYTQFYPWFYADVNFWCLANTEMSTGGWPSILTDNAQDPISHSFYSDDFIVWEPWLVSGKACNYFVRCDWLTGLSSTTWAGIKSVF